MKMSPASKENIEKCSHELDVDFSKKDFESAPEFKCFFKCMMEQDGILVNGTFYQDRFMEVLKDDKELDNVGREKSLRALPSCLDEAKYINDLCNKSFTIIYCLHKVL
ncbi:Obp56h.2 family protein [Megaselia abdita]